MPSTAISSFRYDLKNKALIVVFVSGTVYKYKDVPPEKYEEMKKSRSKGTFLNAMIKGIYDFEKMD